MATSTAPPRALPVVLRALVVALIALDALLCLTDVGRATAVTRLWFLLEVLPLAVLAVLLYRQRPQHRVARLLMLCAGSLVAATAAEGLLFRFGATAPAGVVAALQAVQGVGLLLSISSQGALLATFPTGTTDSRLGRLLVRAVVPLAVVPAAVMLVSRSRWSFGDVAAFRPMPERFPVHVAALDSLHPIAQALFFLPIVAATAGLFVLRRRRGVVAAELQPAARWVWRTSMLACALSALLQVASGTGLLSPEVAAVIPCFFLIPMGMSVATLRYDALDLDLLLRRSAVFAVISAATTAVAVGAAAALGVTASRHLPVGTAVLCATVAVLALGPVRRRLDAVARRRLFGDRVGGYELLGRVGGALEHAYDLAELAPRLAAMVQEGLGVSWARLSVALSDEAPDVVDVLGVAGDPSQGPSARSVPLLHSGLLVGLLECGPRLVGVLTPEDDQVLDGLARQAALAVHNARIAAELAGRLEEIGRQSIELAASRERLVSAQDTERQALERDLHDGAQQEIVALMAKLRMARNRLARGDEAGLDDLLGELQGDARELLDELRELAHGIRPPVLADRGLVGAVEARASRLPLEVSIEADDVVRAARYTDEVEGAAWFVISEAGANALKHSGTDRLVIALAEDAGVLVVRVVDEGCGITAAVAARGLPALRDRVEALGGRLQVEGGSGGTTVTARLPARRRTAVSL